MVIEILVNVVANVLATLVTCSAMGFGAWIGYGRLQQKYAGWQVCLLNGKELAAKPISIGIATVKMWLNDEWQRKIGLKGACADTTRLVVNVLDISEIDYNTKQFVVHLDRNVASK